MDANHLPFWPQDAATWAQLAAAIVAIGAVWLAAARRQTRQVVQKEIDDRLPLKIREALAPLQVQLTTMVGEMARVRDLEQVLNNGLKERLVRGEVRQENMERLLHDIQSRLAYAEGMRGDAHSLRREPD